MNLSIKEQTTGCAKSKKLNCTSRLTPSQSMVCCASRWVWSFPSSSHHISTLHPCIPDRGWVWRFTVSQLPKQEVVRLLSQQKTERKNGISGQNTNQLAGNHTFIILLTLISFQGKCPRSPFFTGPLSLSPRALLRPFELYPLCVRQTQ